jgi:hypothetical protein
VSPEATPSQLPAVTKPIEAKRFRIIGEKYHGPELREYPIATMAPSLPVAIRDEVLDLYAFLFCQGGFRHLGMTFEQFLLVIAAFKPGDLTATIRETIGPNP